MNRSTHVTRARRGPRLGRVVAGVAGSAMVLAAAAHAEGPGQPKPTEEAAPGRAAQEKKEDPGVAIDSARWVPGKGLEFTSRDGSFRLQTRVRAQWLYRALDRFDDADQDRVREQTFQVRRARVVFSGHTYGKNNRFKLELALSPRDLGFTDNGKRNPPVTNSDNTPSRSLLLDYYMDFTQLRDLSIRVGQYKVPFSRQRVISSGDLMFVDRTIVNAEFNVDRDIGVEIRSEDFLGRELLKYYAGVYIGEGHSAYALGGFDYMALGRVELLPFGDFDDYSEADLERSPTPKLSLALATAYIDEAKGNRGILGRRPEDGGTSDIVAVAADALFKWRGLSAQSEFFWRLAERNPGADAEMEAPRNGWGWTGQAGYLLPARDVEFAARYSLIRGTGANTGLSPLHEGGVAASYYVAGHPFKLQGDYLRLWRDRLSDGDHQVRVQLQTSF